MSDYIKNYKNIRICAQAWNNSDAKTLDKCDRVSLKFAVLCMDGIWRTISTDTWNNTVSYARVFNNDTLKETEKVVESPDELTEFINRIKPTDAPSIVLERTNHSFARWAKVSPKGTIGVHYHTVGESHYQEIPLPQNGEVIKDASPSWQGDFYNCNVYWNGADAAQSLWEHATSVLDRLKEFCRTELENEKRELSVGASRIDALLKFQSQAKSVEDQITDKWNSMSTEDKAKALKIKKPVKKTAKKK